MRSGFAVLGLLVAMLFPVPTARAQCAHAGSVANGTCIPQAVLVPFDGLTTVPLLDIEALIADDGSIISLGTGENPDAGVFLTVRGPGPSGGGRLEFPDGGQDPRRDIPLVLQLDRVAIQPTDGGSPTFSLWRGSSPLFHGLNTVTATAREPSGVSVTSDPGAVWLVSARECQDGGIPPPGGCDRVFTAELAPLPARTAIPLLILNALVTDDGMILRLGGPGAPGNVFVTVQGPEPNGGGTLVFLDGGTLRSDSPFGTQLTRIDYIEGKHGAPTYSLWSGVASLFAGLNTLTATATEYGSTPSVSSAPRTIVLDFETSTDGGTDAGTRPDAGTAADGGRLDAGPTDSGTPSSTDGGGDGVRGTGSQSLLSGCSGAADTSPSLALVALAVVLMAVVRRGARR